MAAWHLPRGATAPTVSAPLSRADRPILEAGARLLAHAGVEARGYFHAHAEGRTHYLETAGSDELEPLVLLHGGAGGGANWFAVLNAYARRRRVLAPDLPGFGMSTPIPPGASLGRRAARRLASWLRGIGVRRFAVAGTSFGGLVAAHLAARRDLTVTRLALIDSAGLGRAVHPFLRLASTALVRPAVGMSSRIGARAVFQGLMVHRPRSIPAERRAVLVDYLHACGQAGVDRLVAEALPHFVGWTGQRERADLYVLPDVRCPVMAVSGSHDAIFPARHARRLPQRVGDARAYVIPESGHSPMWETPEALVDATRSFLEATPAVADEVAVTASELPSAAPRPPASGGVPGGARLIDPPPAG
ncbi:MAG TPA: alpha/beta fold hydrolase [Longimicrobiales bacterium]|nr:alpha/beta fold hydrolase [Longimicrobiales bacterium]